MLIQDVTSYIEEKIPVSLKEDYDNVGLLVGESQAVCTGVLISMDITEKSIEEAIEKKCNLIISHHPIIFKGIKSISDKDSTSRLIIKAIRNHISLYALHTNLDNAPQSVSTFLAEKIGLQNIRVLAPVKGGLKKLVTYCPKSHDESLRNALFAAGAGHIGNYDHCSFNSDGSGTFKALEKANPFVGEKGTTHFENETRIEVLYESYMEKAILHALINAHPYEAAAYDCIPITNVGGFVGSGAIGELEKPMPTHSFLKELKETLHIPVLKHSQDLPPTISKVAVCGGSGSFLISNALHSGADLFITSDLTYHHFQLGNHKMGLIDGGHYETEQFGLGEIQTLISEKFSTFVTLISEHNSNYVGYF